MWSMTQIYQLVDSIIIMVGQHEFIMRSRTDSKELGSEEDYKEALEDLTYNVDLFLANQEVNVLE